MKQRDTPLISVIMPVYNASLYLKDSIESILNQTYSNFEFLIFDDGSTDDSSSIVKYYAESDKRIIFFESAENKGYLTHLNKGLQIAKGEYIARMDADDISLPERFLEQLQFIQKQQLYIIGSNIAYFSTKKTIFKNRSHQASNHLDALAQSFFSTPLFHPTIFFRRELLDKGEFMYQQDFYPAEDYELWTRILPKYESGNINKVLVLYRSSQSQVSNNKKDIQQKNTIRAKVNYIHTMCGFMPTDNEARILNDYFYRSSNKKIPVSDIMMLFELFEKIIKGFKNTAVKSYFCKRLGISVCMYCSRNNPYYLEYKKQGFTKYYQPDTILKIKAIIRQSIK